MNPDVITAVAEVAILLLAGTGGVRTILRRIADAEKRNQHQDEQLEALRAGFEKVAQRQDQHADQLRSLAVEVRRERGRYGTQKS